MTSVKATIGVTFAATAILARGKAADENGSPVEPTEPLPANGAACR
jgi:hypothetical protein